MRLLIPLDRALFQFVEKSEHENKKEKENRQKNRQACRQKLTKDEHPGDQENDFDIKQDKEHRSDVELDCKTGVPGTLGQHAALVRGVFNRSIGAALPKNMRRDKDHRADTGGERNLNKDRIVVRDLHSSAMEVCFSGEFKAFLRIKAESIAMTTKE